jgi:hypothetical protein
VYADIRILLTGFIPWLHAPYLGVFFVNGENNLLEAV